MSHSPKPNHPALLACAVILVAACSSSTQSWSPPSTTTHLSAETNTADPNADAEAAIRRVATAWAAAADRIARQPNPKDPALDMYLRGALLAQYVAEWGKRARMGLSTRPARPSHAFYRIDAVKVDGSSAVLHECVLDDGVLFVKATGRVIDDKTYTEELQTTARLEHGAWRLASRRVSEQEGVAGCAATS